MFKKSMEVEQLTIKQERLILEHQVDIRKLNLDHDAVVAELKFKLSVADEEKRLAIEKAKNEIRAQMQQSLIESDLKRVEAVARLESYQSVDTKKDHDKLVEMLELTIKGLSAPRNIEIVK